MTPKEKAKELFYNHYMILFDSDSDKGQEILISLLSIKSAIITVDEIESALINYGMSGELQNMDSELRFWDKVKIELNCR